MSKRHCKVIFAWLLTLFMTQIYAFNYLKYTHKVPVVHADESARSTLIGIMETCGNKTNLDDSCVVQGLDRVAKEESNTVAENMLTTYQVALEEGRYDNPECQTENHIQVNRTVGHCYLLLNYYMLHDVDKNAAVYQYEMCLQGGMLGLAYQSNLAAQYVLTHIFDKRGLSDQAHFWRNSMKARKDSEEYELVMMCYK